MSDASTSLRSQRFRQEREADWAYLEQIVERGEKQSASALSDADILAAPTLYRSALSALSVARETSLDQGVVSYLETLCARAYFFIYGARASLFDQLKSFFTSDWPKSVAGLWREAIAAALIMTLGGLVAFLLVGQDSGWYYAFVPEQLAGGRDPDATKAFLRDTLYHDEGGSGLAAFAAYLFSHNTQVALFCFALGFAFGIPTILLLAYNGAAIGAMIWVFVNKGLGVEIAGWLMIHGVTELFAIVLAGAAGLRIGMSSVFPGDLSRLDNMADAGRKVAPVMGGVVIMLLIAGLLEGFGRQLIITEAGRFSIAAITGLIWLAYFYAPRRAKTNG